MPYRKAAKIIDIPSKSLNIAVRFRALHNRVKEESIAKSRKLKQKKDEKLKVKHDRIDASFLKKFESKHWPKTLKFLEEYIKTNTSAYIELNRLTDSIGNSSSVIKETLREKLKETGFTFEEEDSYSERVCW